MQFFSRDNVRLKWVVLAISVVIATGSIYYTNILVQQLKEREREQVSLYAKAIVSTIACPEVSAVTEQIITRNNSIPTIYRMAEGKYQYRNIDIDPKLSETRLNRMLEQKIAEMRLDYDSIPVNYLSSEGDLENYGAVYYEHSFLLTQLLAYPYIQLTAIFVFGLISFLAFRSSKQAEQNRVWVGLAKETAHQLGTPISSLMGWVEVMRQDPVLSSRGFPEELDRDVRKLQLVAERFSSIGSAPVLKAEPVLEVVNTVISYLRPRFSSKIRIEVNAPEPTLEAMIHAPLFEWVLENLFKNAVDAMENEGRISVNIFKGTGKWIWIEVSDTGKGIPAALLKKVFNPGFTTKKRGWGLGLALARRIIDIYHNGRISVKSSGDSGTTFRIEIRQASSSSA